jgi:hypothetical protein
MPPTTPELVTAAGGERHVELGFSKTETVWYSVEEWAHPGNFCFDFFFIDIFSCSSFQFFSNSDILKSGHLYFYLRDSTVRNVRFEVFMAVTMKIDVFWDVTPCGSCRTDVSET